MPIPRIIMIDTNVFDQHAYHFASPTIQKFVDLNKVEPITLLLPDPVTREVTRHIKEGARAVASGLKKLSKEARLIYRWPNWPGSAAAKSADKDTENATLADWNKFLTNF